MLTLNEIRNVNFRKANFGGYRAEDVEAFIDEVQLSYDTLLRENAELVKKLEVLAARLEEYQSEEDSIRNALMNAQKVGDASLRDAKHKAEIILKDATIKAEKIVASAQAEISQEREIIERMQRDIAEFKTRLLRAYKEHLALINGLPTEDIMRPETREMVDSVQMLDRRAVAPTYDQQPVTPTGHPVAPEEGRGDRPRREARAPRDAAPQPADGGFAEAPRAAQPSMPTERPQRKGGFTVDIGEEGAAGDSRITPPAEPTPSRRAPRFPAASFEDEADVPVDRAQMAGVRLGDGAAPAAPGEGEEEIGTPASLFRRRK
ncbi:MAG: DivIVA domain-containing protein [Ruminococcaceae bacterium]|nr:DivIVA domain-containing protein [Oscillospiraceae bacterium]